ncbi:MAG TPA: tetratricopeptide repeat protein [Azospirillum sp.]|nr:tetratricopeptide repeat protein [Azospirillum sp.]
MDFGVLTGPLLALLAVFGVAVISDPQTIYIETITVPAALNERGYSSEVVEQRLIDQIQSMEREAKSRSELRRMATEAEPSAVKLVSEYLGVTPLVRVMQDSFGLIGYAFDGEVVRNGETLQITLRGRRRYEGESLAIVSRGDLANPDAMIRDAALEMMGVIDPYIRSAYQFKQDLPTRDFTRTKALINRYVEQKETRQRLWLHNLHGIVHYIEGDWERAKAEFAATLAIEPDFSLALLNHGVVLAREGRHDEAIKRYAEVFRRQLPSDAPQTYAATYSEWGMSLAALGRTDEAFAAFKAATAADPKFADVYFNWAEVLRKQGRADEAEAMAVKGRRLGSESTVYTENILGVIQEMGTAKGKPAGTT